MTDKAQRETRRVQQTREVEENQAALRASIAESQRLIEEASRMTKRHRQELDDDDAA